MIAKSVSIAAALLIASTASAFAQEDGQRESGPAQQERAQPEQRAQEEARPQREERQAERPERENGQDRGERPEPAQQQEEGRPERAEREEGAEPQREQRAEELQQRQERASREEIREQRGEGAERREQQREQRTEEQQQQEQRAEQPEEREQRAEEDQQEQRAEEREQQEQRAEQPEERREQRAEEDREQPEQRREGRAEREDQRREGRAERRDEAREERRVELDEEDRRRVSRRFREHHGDKRRYRDVDIEITFGRTLPGDWEYYDVPAFIVEFAPWYSGYDYVYVGNRYVIVEPDTREVAAYVDAETGRVYTGARTAGRAGACDDIELTAAEERRILRAIEVRDRADVSGISIGVTLPGGVELFNFPQDVGRDIGVADCRYVALDDDRIALVAPDNRRVVSIVTR